MRFAPQDAAAPAPSKTQTRMERRRGGHRTTEGECRFVTPLL